MTQSPPVPKKRFPRLVTGEEAGASSLLLRQDPQRSVRVAEDGSAIEFVFRIPVPIEIRRESVPLRLLCDDSPKCWEETLSRLDWNMPYGKKTVGRWISLCLHRILEQALDIWIKESYELVRAAQKGDAERQIFKKKAHCTRGPQPNYAIALRAARRYPEVLRQVKELKVALRTLRKRGKAKHGLSTKEARTIIGNRLPCEVLQRALDTLLGTDDHNSPWRLLAPGLPPTQIAEKYVACTLEDEGADLGRVSIGSHIRLGNRLIAALSGERTSGATVTPSS